MDDATKERQQITFERINELLSLMRNNPLNQEQVKHAISALTVSADMLHQRLCRLEGGDCTEVRRKS